MKIKITPNSVEVVDSEVKLCSDFQEIEIELKSGRVLHIDLDDTEGQNALSYGNCWLQKLFNADEIEIEYKSGRIRNINLENKT